MNGISLSRRSFLFNATCLAVLGAQTRIVQAELRLGPSARITTVSDGYLSLPPDVVFGAMPKEEIEQILIRNQADATKYEPECNVALYQDDQNSVLFDVGAGPDFMPTSGKLLEALETTDL